MNPRHFLAHVVTAQPRPPALPRRDVGEHVLREIRKTLSKTEFSQSLKERLATDARHQAIAQDLDALEGELARLESLQADRARTLRSKLARLRAEHEKRRKNN